MQIGDSNTIPVSGGTCKREFTVITNFPPLLQAASYLTRGSQTSMSLCKFERQKSQSADRAASFEKGNSDTGMLV